MTHPFTGSPIAHPQKKHVRTYAGRVEDQSEEIAQFMSMLQAGWSTERAPKPVGEIILVLEQKETIFGTLLLESMSSVRDETSQFILTRWDEQIFHWYLVQIKTDLTFVVEEYENPADPLRARSSRILA